MVDTHWAQFRLDSPLYAALVQAVETTVPAIAADAAAGRLYDPPQATPPAYVSTGRLGAAPQDEPVIHDWPTAPHAVFEHFAGQYLQLPADQPFRPTDLLERDHADRRQTPDAHHEPAGRAAAVDGLFGPLHHSGHIADAIGLNLPLAARTRCVLLFVRCAGKAPFDEAQLDRLAQLGPMLVQTMTRALHQQLNAAPAHARGVGRASDAEVTTPATESPVQDMVAESAAPNASALLQRLSRTERRVLTYLRQHRTERQVADRLQRSPHTVHVHVKNIYRKLAVRSRHELLELFRDT